jgi:CheY-like chemotaxis protein
LQSQFGQGSCFWFKIPFAKQPGGEKEPPHASLGTLCGRRVLVVDDSATNRQILLDQLAHWQMEPAQAATHGQALALLAEAAQANSVFDLVLLDLEMPEESGLNLACAIKSDSSTASCRLVAMTSFWGRTSVGDMQAAGIVGRLIKPIRASRLRDCLVRVLQPGGENDFEALEGGLLAKPAAGQ